MIQKLETLLLQCENESDFWPNTRHFINVGEYALAFEGIYLYLLSRDDLWKQHHALVKSLKSQMAKAIDFDELETSVFDDGRYCDTKAVIEWRETVVKNLSLDTPQSKKQT